MGVESLKYRGSVSKDGALILKKGVYYDDLLKPELHDSLQEKNGFGLYLSFMTSDQQQGDGVIFSYGKDEKDFNFKFESRGNDIYLVTRQYLNKKPVIREQKLLTAKKELYRLFVSYRPGKLQVFRHTKKVVEFDDYSGLMENWLTLPFSFGDHLKGTHKYWSGSIYNFALFSAFVDERRMAEIISLLNRKFEKPGKRFKR